MSRAVHHAPQVKEVLLALAGAVVLFKDAESKIKVRTHSGKTANVLWVEIKQKEYALTYNHNDHSVDIKLGLRGKTLASFDNKTSVQNILKIFENL